MSDVREPAVAGQFYAGTATELRDQIERAFSHPMGPGGLQASDPDASIPRGLVSPHAGYPYSGPVAAHGFDRLHVGGRPEAAVIVGPNHSGRGEPLAISAVDAWETPMGRVPIADDLRSALTSVDGIAIDEATHAAEHSLEVQVPFLQYLFADPVPIVPIVLTHQDRRRVETLSTALADLQSEHEDIVVIASTDLTHYEPASRARERDEPIRRAIRDLDADAVMEAAAAGHTMCGAAPTAAMLEAAAAGGASVGAVLQYGTSGDTAGGSDSVVGYVAAAVE
ncbi:MAG: AmmeMemoRadiSam system protein B [Halodesulfurarchaeum sp.]